MEQTYYKNLTAEQSAKAIETLVNKYKELSKECDEWREIKNRGEIRAEQKSDEDAQKMAEMSKDIYMQKLRSWSELYDALKIMGISIYKY
jgi:hypothetical protein